MTVTVRVGTEELTATSAEADPAIWSVNVPGNAAYIVGSSVAVTVSAAKTGYTAPNAQTPTLTVDLMGPVAPTYAAPSSLRVGVALTEMNPTGGADIHEYGAPGLPSGLSIDAGSGVIGGTPDTANASTASVRVTVKDTAGNAATVDIAFPAVAKGAQPLTGFRYSAISVTFGDTAPTVTVPSGARGALSYSATPLAVCTVEPSSGALTIVGAGDCEVTVTAAVTADYEVATAMFTVAVAKGAQPLTGFRYSAASVTFGDTAPTVTVPSGAQGALSYSATPATVCTVGRSSGALTIVGAGDCEVTVTAAVTADYEVATAMFTVTVAKGAQPLTGFRYSAASVTFGDTAPAVTMPSGAQGALSYSATAPAVCTVDPGSGALTIVGVGDCEVTVTAAVERPTTNQATAMYTVTVVKGAQTLSGFQYSASNTVTFGDTAPTVTAPSGAQTALSYSATPPAVCTVNPNSGVLTLEEVGDCEVTVTAVGTANYEVATAMFTVMVDPAGALMLKVNAIATDGTVNIAERAAGFAISGDTGSEGGRDGDGEGGHGGADGDLGGGRSGDLVGERAGECGVHRGFERGGDGERGEDRLHRAECADAHADGGSDGAGGADVRGAFVVAGGCSAHGDESHRRRRHPRVRRPGAAVGVEHRRGQRCHRRDPGHRQRQHRQREGDGEGHGGQRRHG